MSGLNTTGVAITSDGQDLLLPATFSSDELETIAGCKESILAQLRTRQLDAAGFYVELPRAMLDEISAAGWVGLSIHATAASRFSPALRFNPGTRVGAQSWQEYRADHPGVRLNTTPRLRVLALHTEALGTCVWELDRLGAESRQKLFTAALADKTVVGHDLGADLAWLFLETSARPRMVLDSSLLSRLLRPETLLRPYRQAVHAESAVKERAIAAIRRSEGQPSTSLHYMAAAMGLPALDHAYDELRIWGLTLLSAEHHAYATDKLTVCRQTVASVLRGLRVEDMAEYLDEHAPWYRSYSDAAVRLAETHGRGTPFDLAAAQALREDCRTTVVEIAQGLGQLASFAPLLPNLKDERKGEGREIRNAAMAAADENSAVAEMLGALRAAKSACRNLARYMDVAEADGRLHTLVTFAANTGRTASTAPSLQNVPKDARFRALIKAAPGHLILSVDYTAIELRIASRLAARAISDIRQRLRHSSGKDCWFMRRVRQGAQGPQQLPACPDERSMPRLEWLQQAIPAVAQRVLCRREQTMASLFERDLDPHLVTAVEMVRKAGGLQADGNVVGWLASMTSDGRRSLQSELKEERQRAKPANFGLLYGMTAEGLHRSGIDNYGLRWNLGDAHAARTAWFELYPEMRLWHLWTEFLAIKRLPVGYCATWEPYRRCLRLPETRVKLYRPTTLQGRRIAVLGDRRRALNYQTQGTGADILAAAIAQLPRRIAGMLLVPVHDELVFEVPVQEAEAIRICVEETMIQAAQNVLGPGVQVESAMGETWGG